MSVQNLLILGFKHWPNYSTLWPTRPVLRTFVHYLIIFCSRPESGSDVISCKFVERIVSDKCVKLVNLAQTVLEKFLPYPSQAAFSTVFSAITSDWK